MICYNWAGFGQVDFWQKIGTKGAKFPIGRFQFIQGNGRRQQIEYAP